MNEKITEEWKPMPGHSGFYASNLGRIRRDGWIDQRGRQMKGYVLQPRFVDAKQTAPWCKAVGPYFRVVPDDGKPVYVAGADLVAMAWLDFDASKVDGIDFRNEDATDIRLSNLVVRPKRIINMYRRITKHARRNFQLSQ